MADDVIDDHVEGGTMKYLHRGRIDWRKQGELLKIEVYDVKI